MHRIKHVRGKSNKYLSIPCTREGCDCQRPVASEQRTFHRPTCESEKRQRGCKTPLSIVLPLNIQTLYLLAQIQDCLSISAFRYLFPPVIPFLILFHFSFLLRSFSIPLIILLPSRSFVFPSVTF